MSYAKHRRSGLLVPRRLNAQMSSSYERQRDRQPREELESVGGRPELCCNAGTAPAAATGQGRGPQ